MPRVPTSRPAAEHIGNLSRMAGQVEADTKMDPRSRARIKKLVSDLMSEFQKELTK